MVGSSCSEQETASGERESASDLPARRSPPSARRLSLPLANMTDIGDDPRFHAGVAALNAHDYFDASEIFEDLFFEAVRDEVPFARLFLQVAVGAHHLERGQRGAAADRLAEGL